MQKNAKHARVKVTRRNCPDRSSIFNPDPEIWKLLLGMRGEGEVMEGEETVEEVETGEEGEERRECR